MRSNRNLRLTAAALLIALFAVGCNPLTGAYFFLFGLDDKIQPEFKLAKEGKKSTHVLILTSFIGESPSDLLGFERQLTAAIVKELDIGSKANKEKLKIIPTHKIEEFKSANPGWKTMTANQIGRQFDVDYVVDVEVASAGLYERDSRKRLFRGRAALTVSVVDVAKSADEGAAHQRQLTIEYPKARGPIPVDDDMTVERFRELFLQRIAQDVTWQLTAHVSTADLMRD